MSWGTSDRRSRLPADWPKIRKRILRRDGRVCQWREDGLICGKPATDVDHIVPGDDHRETNLRALCGHHHQIKSSSEGGAARAAKRRKIDKSFRRTEDHPGML